MGVLAVAGGAAGLGTPGPAGDRIRRCRSVLLESRRCRAGALLLGSREEHVGELAGILLRRVRPWGDDHHRQARGFIPAAGAVGADLRFPPVGAGPASGDRRCHLGAGDVPHGPSLEGSSGGTARSGNPGLHPDRVLHVRTQHGGRRADNVPGAGRRRLAVGGPERELASAAVVRSLGGPGVPGQDAAGVDDPTGLGDRLPGECPGALGPQNRTARRRRYGDAGGVTVMDRPLHAHSRREPTVRRRVHEQQCRGHGLRLQRSGAFRS